MLYVYSRNRRGTIYMLYIYTYYALVKIFKKSPENKTSKVKSPSCSCFSSNSTVQNMEKNKQLLQAQPKEGTFRPHTPRGPCRFEAGADANRTERRFERKMFFSTCIYTPFFASLENPQFLTSRGSPPFCHQVWMS